MKISTRQWSTNLLDIDIYSSLFCASLLPFSCCFIQALSVNKATLKNPIEPFLLGIFIGIGPAINRGTIRKRYHLEGTLTKDCLISLLFCLAVTQEYKEVEFREKRMEYNPKRLN